MSSLWDFGGNGLGELNSSNGFSHGFPIVASGVSHSLEPPIPSAALTRLHLFLNTRSTSQTHGTIIWMPGEGMRGPGKSFGLNR